MLSRALSSLLTCSVVLASSVQDIYENAFRKVVDARYYDKTLFVKYFHELSSPVIFNAPRVFGKTVNLEMLRAFYEINVDKNGMHVAKNTTKNYATFQKLTLRKKVNTTLFEDEKFFTEHFGNTPIVHLSFAALTVKSFKGFCNSLQLAVNAAYRHHSYLLVSSILNTADRAEVKELKKFNVNLDEDILSVTGKKLTEKLERHFGRPCIVLIDDFDAPILNLLNGGLVDITEISNVMKRFLQNLLIDNEAVVKSYITGVTRLSEVYSPDSNHVKRWSLSMNEDIAKFFGLTASEVISLIRGEPKDLKGIQFYKGYRVLNSDIRIYNPFSVTGFEKTHQKKTFWAATGNLIFLNSLFEKDTVRDMIMNMAIGRDLHVKYVKEIDCQEISDLMDFLKPTGSVDQKPHYLDILTRYLWDLGYLTIKDKVTDGFNLIIPNVELRLTFFRFLAQSFRIYHKTRMQAVEMFDVAFRRLNNETISFDLLSDSIVALFSDSPHPPLTKNDIKSPLYVYIMQELKLPADYNTTRNNELVDLIGLTKYNHFPSNTGVVFEFEYGDCSDYKPLRQLLKQGSWDLLYTNERYENVTNFVLAGVCLNKKRQFEFSYLYNSTVFKNTYHTVKNVASWQALDVLRA